MKPYQELTRSGRLRRMRNLAQKALLDYDLPDASLKFVHYEGNIIFRADVPKKEIDPSLPPYFVPNRYNLRILTTGDESAIHSEMLWLAALRQEAGLPVQEPVPTKMGDLLTHVSTPGVPKGRYVSVMRWVAGRQLDKGLRPHHLRSLGTVVAALHNFSAQWQPPDGFSRWHWDWEGQLNGRDFDCPVAELVGLMPAELQQPFTHVSERVRRATEALGKGADAYGLAHCDLYPENVLYQGSQAIPIDFEDFGYGYWIWDIAVALCSWPWTEKWPQMRDAFFEGYLSVRTLPDDQINQLSLFMAAQYATMVLWATYFIKRDPAMLPDHEPWRAGEGEKLLRYMALYG